MATSNKEAQLAPAGLNTCSNRAPLLIMRPPSPLWIFGYGSLVWRPDMPFVERRPCFIEGFRRRFWQGSTDHRGVPGAPGRVVTLLPKAGERCFGVAYRIAVDEEAAVVARLDHREKGGYEQLVVPVHAADGGARFADALVYVATKENDNYLGCAPLPDIADQVVASTGPSGSNVEYVLELATALREMGAEDGHVFRLERLVRERA